MKICARCNMKLKDEETYCSRCGGNVFKTPQPKPKAPQPQNGANNVQVMTTAQHTAMHNQNMGNMQMNPNMQQMGNNMQMNGMQMNPNMQQMNGMQMGNNMQQMNGMQQVNNQSGLKSLFKSPKQKKAEMQAEMAMMKQMQQQKQQNQQMQGTPQNNVQQNRVNTANNANLFNNNQFSDVQPDMSVNEWIKALIMLMIPIVNLVFIFKGMNEPMNPPYPIPNPQSPIPNPQSPIPILMLNI